MVPSFVNPLMNNQINMEILLKDFAEFSLFKIVCLGGFRISLRILLIL